MSKNNYQVDGSFSLVVEFVKQAAGSIRTCAPVIISTLLVFGVLVTGFTGLVAAAETETPTGSVDSCETGPLEPLISLLDTINQLLLAVGIALGGIGFVSSGILFAIPGQKYNRLGQTVAKNTFIGVLLILSSDLIVNFLISQLGGIC